MVTDNQIKNFLNNCRQCNIKIRTLKTNLPLKNCKFHLLEKMLTQIGKRMLTSPFPFSRLSDQSKQRLSTCAVGTFVLAPLFPSACNRETSSKCKKGSFLRVLPRKSRHVTKTTLSFTDSACQESDSLRAASFPLFSPPHRY